MQDYRIIDVSQWMDDFRFPGNPSFSVEGPFNRVTGSSPEFVYDFTSCTQTGTHIQGPHYFLKDGRTIETFPLEDFEGDAVLIDIEKRGEDTTRSDLESLLDEADCKLEILILRSGNMEEIISSGSIDPTRRPGLSMDAAKFLAEETNFKMLAIDSIGFESRITKNFEVNVYLCSKEILLLEGLVNLNSVSQRKVQLQAFPLKLKGVEGTPCRAIIRETL